MNRLEKKFKEKVCWITGGGSGIGKALAIQIAELGGHSVISGRKISSLEEVASAHSNISPLQLDVTNIDEWKSSVDKIQSKYGKLDYLILNAGTCEYVDLPEFDSKLFERVFDANFMGVVRGIEACFPVLRKNNESHITAVTSSVASLALPRAEAYGASKAAATYLMNSLRLDLANSGIGISIALPGFVTTPMTDKNDFPMPFKISPESAALKILRGIANNKKEIYFPGRFTWPLRFLGSLPISLQQVFTRSFVR